MDPQMHGISKKKKKKTCVVVSLHAGGKAGKEPGRAWSICLRTRSWKRYVRSGMETYAFALMEDMYDAVNVDKGAAARYEA
jgi:hypothetical protein